MMTRISFSIVILALSMACAGGSTPTSPTQVATPAQPTAPAAAKVVSISINASRDVVAVNFTSVLTSIARYDDGSTAPITATWESSSGLVTLVQNGPVTLATGQGVGNAVITARAEGFSASQSLTVQSPF